ncbi:MAG: ankyrin repeat domain-containing protein [Alphaproteobacteria bacterium]
MLTRTFNSKAANEYEQRRLDSDLMGAVRLSSTIQVEVHLSRGANPNATDDSGMPAIISAAHSRNARHIRALAKAGADVNTKDKHGKTALMYCVECFAVDAVDALLECKADPNIPDNDGNTALMYTAEFAQVDMVDRLVKAGADVLILNKDNESACDLLRKRGTPIKDDLGGVIFDSAEAARKADDSHNPALKKDIKAMAPLRLKSNP